MIKIIILSAALILIVLGMNFFWVAGGKIKINSSEKQKFLQNLQEAPRLLPQKAVGSVKGAIDGVEKSMTSYLMAKTGQEIVNLLKTLPVKQQEEIKKEYCGD